MAERSKQLQVGQIYTEGRVSHHLHSLISFVLLSTNAMRQLRALGNVPGSSEANGSSAPAKKTKKSKKDKRNKKGITSGDADGEADNGDEGPLTATGADGTLSKKQAAQTAASAGAGAVTDCCICLFSVTVYQALFIAPCSHIFHFKYVSSVVCTSCSLTDGQ